MAGVVCSYRLEALDQYTICLAFVAGNPSKNSEMLGQAQRRMLQLGFMTLADACSCEATLLSQITPRVIPSSGED